MRTHRKEFPIEKMAKVLEVSRNGYYKYINREESITKEENKKIIESIIEIREENKKKEAYGSPRMRIELNKRGGTKYSRKRVANLMKEHGIMARNKKDWKYIPKKANDPKIASNLINQNFTVNEPDTVYLSDITYIETGEGWLFVSAALDVFSRKIVGLSMGSRMDTDLIKRSLDQAICHRAPKSGLILHSDRGSQYTSAEYRAHALKHGISLSMSAPGNPYDNSPMESFFGTLKKEHANWCNFKTREEATRSIFEYIEVFYNRERLHSTLDYMSPFEFEQNWIIESKNNMRVG